MPVFLPLDEGVFDLEDLKYRTNELADFVAAAAQHYGFSSDQLVAVGYSNGANIAASMLLFRPEILRAAILFRAMVPLVPDRLADLHPCVCGSARVLRIRLFPLPRFTSCPISPPRRRRR